MADPNKVTVYCDSYLTSGAANELAAGAFGTVVLPFPDASDEMLRQNIQRLKSEGMVSNVLFSVRGDLAKVDQAAMAKAIAYYGIDGIDLEPEEVSAKHFYPIVELIAWASSMDKMVTAAPAGQPQVWVEVLQASIGE